MHDIAQHLNSKINLVNLLKGLNFEPKYKRIKDGKDDDAINSLSASSRERTNTVYSYLKAGYI